MNAAARLLMRAASRFGDRPAFRDEDCTLSFSALHEYAQHIASGLLPLTEAGKLTPIVVLLPKAASTVAAFMGVLYSGNPYVPLDYKTPPARLAKILETIGDCLIISDEAGVARLAEAGLDALTLDALLATALCEAGIEERLSAVTDADPAYLMFTSGSTGTPKGVVVPQRAVLDYARWVTETFAFDTTTRLGNQAAFYFANSLFDIYGALYSGAEVCLIPEILFTFPSKLPAYLVDEGINALFWVPTVMKNIANSGVLAELPLHQLRTVAFCGEILSNTYLNVWRRFVPQARYANLYGMTEAADACCYFFIEREYSDDEALPIGRPCRNMRAWILDEEGAECAVGEVGEICIAGAGLASGYWNRDDLTAAAFTRNPLEARWAQTVYHTGDLGLRGSDGLLYVRGRTDSQVKVKGNRIELGEVERAASTLVDAENVCVLFDAEPEHIVLLVQTEENLRLRPVNQQLKALLPQYMLPARLELLEQFPLTASGKIDRMCLRERYALQ
jgi:amino acid adenylation domain-containing protein